MTQKAVDLGKLQDEFVAAAKAARKENLGLWGGCSG